MSSGLPARPGAPGAPRGRRKGPCPARPRRQGVRRPRPAGRGGALSQQRLGRRQGVDRTTMVAVIDELERKGLVERRRNPRDRRAYSLHATAEGRRVLGRAGQAAKRAEHEFLAPIPPGDRRHLKDLLRMLVSS
ncbi:MAG: MarR family winged helix-turn-helix transcriptional regulator [Thermoleophilaceae bacterium]